VAVKCGNCGLELNEASDVPEERTPCPDCGSTARRFEVELSGVIVAAPTIQAKGTVLQPTVSVLPGVSPKAFDALAAAIQERNPDHVRTLCLNELSDGAFMSEVLDENGVSLASGLGDHEDDAILELADHLKRPEA
jgi:hypothetical protein